VHVISAESTELFVGPPDAPLQLARVTLSGCAEPTRLQVDGDGLSGAALVAAGQDVVEIPVAVAAPAAGQRRTGRVQVGDVWSPLAFTVAEPGWTMFMISHFHYDPVWWNTQGAYTSGWQPDPPSRCRNGFELVHAHLELARREPVYKFVLAEVDYLKPYWDTHPQDRADLRRFIADGRVEVMGGTYNEPNTNLTSPETTIRNLVHGMGFQRDVLGAAPATAWQLDVFGHDPQFPGMAADAGLTSSSWARGPHHQWGPMHSEGGVAGMQFCSEFEWIAPSGRGLLTHYMPAHYGAGWGMDDAASLAEAEQAAYRLFTELRKVALTRNVLLPVGTDYTPPNKWVTDIHRDWAARYTWPRFVCALPREFFAAVRADLEARALAPSPQTRDMNPIYTGKDVSFIDTKQANRAAEHAVLDAEKFAVFAGVLAGAEYPQAALAKAWVQLVYGAHHDAITGSESDQVYLDLVTGWRDAWELGSAARDDALAVLSRAVPGDLVVWNPLAHERTDVITARLDRPPGGLRVLGDDGTELPALVEHGGRSVSFLARDVPSLGWRAYRLVGADAPAGWQPAPGCEIANEHYRLVVDPGRGGGVSSLRHGEQELMADGKVGNELALYAEYPAHPTGGEGPWHLLPKGPVVGSSETRAQVRAYRSAIGQRLVVRGRIGTLLRYTQMLTLWHGVARVDCRTTIDEFTGEDQLLRLRWPCPVPGAVAVSEVGDAVVGRGFALLHEPGTGRSVDTARHPWTLDNPAHGWFGLSDAVRVRHADGLAAMAVAEVVTPSESLSGALARDLVVALARAGVTATCSSADKPRYGRLSVDSNLPDTRIALGGPGDNAFTEAVLAAADPGYRTELDRQLAATGRARVWVPAAAPLASVWVPGADLREPRALPVLVIAGRDDTDLAPAIAALADDLADAEIVVGQQVPSGLGRHDSRTVALLNRGVPGFAVDIDGTLHTALMRSCTGWPSGIWIDEPRRTAPDGSNFALQHWTHTFDYALVADVGDWRQAGIPARSAEFSHPLLASAGRGEALPATGSLLQVDAPVHLAALKPAGNPLARGSARPVDPRSVAIRLVEPHGADTDVTVSSPLGTVSELYAADLLEQPWEHRRVTALHGYQIATALARLEIPRMLDGAVSARQAEIAQPLYARYWLHNRGPAPLGGLPAVAHLHPDRVSAPAGGELRLRLTAVSDCSDATLSGRVVLVCPAGWSATPAELPFTLQPGQGAEADVDVRVPPHAGPGRYPLRARLCVTGDVPMAWRQVVEDVCLVSVGECDADRPVFLVDGPADVQVPAGAATRLTVTVGTDACAELALEAQLVSPWGTWEWIGPPALGAVLPARGTVELGFDVAPPCWLAPGRWWALVRVGCAGNLLYSPAVQVAVV
jgi:alpha-mannosidase